LLVEAVQQVAGLVVGRDVPGDVEGRDGQVCREAHVRPWRLQGAVHRLGQRDVRRAILVDLTGRFARVRNTVSAGEVAVKAVEAPVFLVHDDQVVDLLDAGSRL